MDCVVRDEWSFVSKTHVSHQHTSTYAYNTHKHVNIIQACMHAAHFMNMHAHSMHICMYCMYTIYNVHDMCSMALHTTPM